MDTPSTAASSAVSLPAYFVNYSSGTILATLQTNYSRSHLLTIQTHTTVHSIVVGQNSEQGGVKVSLDDGDDEEDDSFGEHYFHICIYIWACVVISSLIALSVKWGCCGRSLTRWEVKRIPLKRFQKVEGEDSQDKCPICHEEFHEERLIRQLPCNHCYHSYCVDRWLVKMSNRCPLCKQRVSISLLCPWNKQRRKKASNGHLTADMEASMDDSPPLPPLSTLTPCNWFGEEIMSGPSKFIIMRPGKPTRVIDFRESKKPPVSSVNNSNRDEEASQHVALSNSQNFENIETEQHCNPENICEVSNISSENTAKTVFQMDNILHTEIQIPSTRSSRSCSISSNEPLLFQNQCGFGDESEAQNELNPNGQSLRLGFALTPLVHTEVGSISVQCCTQELDSKSLPTVKEFDQREAAKAIVSISSRSNSVVSCNEKTTGTKTELYNPSRSTHKTPIFSKHSTSLASLDWPKCASSTTLDRPKIISGCTSPVLAFHNKRHTLPGSIANKQNLSEFEPSNVTFNYIHEKFRKSAIVREGANDS